MTITNFPIDKKHLLECTKAVRGPEDYRPPPIFRGLPLQGLLPPRGLPRGLPLQDYPHLPRITPPMITSPRIIPRGLPPQGLPPVPPSDDYPSKDYLPEDYPRGLSRGLPLQGLPPRGLPAEDYPCPPSAVRAVNVTELIKCSHMNISDDTLPLSKMLNPSHTSYRFNLVQILHFFKSPSRHAPTVIKQDQQLGICVLLLIIFLKLLQFEFQRKG